MCETIRRSRIGVMPLALGDKALDAFRLLLLRVNTEQDSLEFSIAPVPTSKNWVLENLQEGSRPSRDRLLARARSFFDGYVAALAQEAKGYGLRPSRYDGLVILSMAAFTSNHYSAHRDRLRIIALGNWKKSMAPPSLLEFFLLLTVRYGIGFLDASFHKGQHCDTRGCLFDYNPTLDETRYKLLLGHVCHDCREALEARGLLEIVKDVQKVFQPSWLGSESEPSSPASLTKKLGYSLFITKGLAPTRWEKLRSCFNREAVGFVAQVLAGLALAAILILLGVRA